MQDTSDQRTDSRSSGRKREPEAGPRAEENEAQPQGGAPLDPEAAETGAARDDAPAEAIDYKDRWLRAEADLQNYRRRVRRELEEGRRGAEEAVLLDLVALLDDLERALQSAGEAGPPPSWTEGVALVLQKGRDYLERQGVMTVDPVGQPFDPRFHEAILEVPAAEDVAPGTVTQVVHRGYRRGERALRAARVVVAGEGAKEA